MNTITREPVEISSRNYQGVILWSMVRKWLHRGVRVVIKRVVVVGLDQFKIVGTPVLLELHGAGMLERVFFGMSMHVLFSFIFVPFVSVLSSMVNR